MPRGDRARLRVLQSFSFSLDYQPDVNPDGTAPVNALPPKLAVTSSVAEAAAKSGNSVLPASAPRLMPPAPGAGLAVPLPFQLPAGALLNQIKPAVRSTAMPMTALL